MSPTKRARPHQGPPPADLRGFPLWRGRHGLWRAGRTRRANPWWFDDSAAGRFNPTTPGRGACYLGLDELAGLIEVLGPEMIGGTVHLDDLTSRSIYRLDPARRPRRVADLASRKAVGFGATNELSTTTPYTRPQQWAAALDDAGHAGLRYRTRFDTGEAARGLVAFGPAGRDPLHWGHPTERIAAEHLQALLARECGITTITTPELRTLPSAPDPS